MSAYDKRLVAKFCDSAKGIGVFSLNVCDNKVKFLAVITEVFYFLEKLAEIKGISPKEMAEILGENTRRVFKL